MSLRAVIPVKPFSKGKSRLSQVFDPKVLYRLNVTLFFRTLQTVVLSQVFDEVLVVSRSKRALRWADQKGLSTLLEASPHSLNSAIKQAISFLDAKERDGLVILPTDLPLMTTDDLRNLVKLGQKSDMVIVPDCHQAGTNAICLNAKARFEPSFGFGSFQKHCKLALKDDLSVSVWMNKCLQRDLDTQPDWEVIQSQTDLSEIKHKPFERISSS